MWQQDPQTGEWFDDQGDYLSGDPYGDELASGNMFMQNLGMPQAQIDYDKRGNEMPYGIQTQARQANFGQDILQMLFDPRLGALTSSMTGGPGFDYMGLMESPDPYYGGGGGGGGGYSQGGGGGGYGGGGYGSGAVVGTPLMDRMMSSDDDVLRAISEQMAEKDPATIKKWLRKEYANDPDTRDFYASTVDDLWKEQSAYLSSAASMGGVGPDGMPRMSPENYELKKMTDKWGINMMDAYTEDNLPSDMMDTSETMAPQYAAGDRALTNLEAMQKRFDDLTKGSWTENLFDKRDPSGESAVKALPGGGAGPMSAIARAAGSMGGRSGFAGTGTDDPVAMDTPTTISQNMLDFYEKHPDKVEGLRPELESEVLQRLAAGRAAQHMKPGAAQGLLRQSGLGGLTGDSEPRGRIGSAFSQLGLGRNSASTPQRGSWTNALSRSLGIGGGVSSGGGGSGWKVGDAPSRRTGTGSTRSVNGHNPRYDASKAKAASRGFAQRSLEAQRKFVGQQQRDMEESDRAIRASRARNLQQSGRTPQRDAIEARMATLRQLGIRI